MSRPSSQPSAGAPRNYHQDYIVRIRYQNSLPPPPNPPKLLDILNPALSRYTSTAFASKLAREQPLNIEVDSELGMPLDLVHAQGVFDKDSKEGNALQPLVPPPPVHPNDRSLLRPASALGKATIANPTGSSGVSFLRRTEYIANESTKSTFKSTTSATLLQSAPTAKRNRAMAASAKAQQESDPVRILAAVLRGFDIANPETVGQSFVAKAPTEDKAIKLAEENWKNVRHPTKPGVKPVAFYPVLPDPEALGEISGYCQYKFVVDPLGTAGLNKQKKRDERLDVSLIRIRYLADELLAANEVQGSQQPASSKERERNTTLDFYVPSEQSNHNARAIKRKFSDLEGANDTPEEAENPEGGPIDGFKYQFVRAYQQHDVKYIENNQEVALVLHDPEAKKSSNAKSDDDGDLFGDEDQAPGSKGMCGRKKQKGAYWYPIVMKSVLRVKRNEKMAEAFFRPMTGARIKNEKDMEAEGRIDLLNVRVRGLADDEKARIGEMANRFLYEGDKGRA